MPCEERPENHITGVTYRIERLAKVLGSRGVALIYLALLIPGLSFQSPLSSALSLKADAGTQPAPPAVQAAVGKSIDKLRSFPQSPKPWYDHYHAPPVKPPEPVQALPAPIAPASPPPAPERLTEPENASQSNQAQNWPNEYVPGQCTWYVASRRHVPPYWGNAVSWLGNAQAAGWATGPSPHVGAIAWTGRGWAGHVAIVESVEPGTVTIAEMNALAGPYRVDLQTLPNSDFYYIY